jgi:cytochrome c biogenesis protein
MSQIAPSLQRSEPVDDLDGGVAISPNVVFEKIWHFFISMRTGLVLILALALFALVGTLLAQVPAAVAADPQAYAAWLDSVRPKYGGWTDVFGTLGFFAIFSSLWFKGTVALLMTSIVACSANRAPHLWKQATHPRLNMNETFFEHAPLHATIDGPADEEATLADVQGGFKAHRYRTVVEREPDGETIHVFADRYRWAPFGTVIAHLSLVLVLIGVVVGNAAGFRNSEFAAPIGTSVDVGFGTGLSVVAKSFTDSYDAQTGAPSDYASDLVVYKDGQQVAAQTIRVNDPLRVGDVTFYQSFFGPAAAMQVKDATGTLVYDAGVPLMWNSNDGLARVGQFALPDQGLTVWVAGAESGRQNPNIKAGQMEVQVYRTGSDTALADQVVDQGKPVRIGDLTYTFVREHQFTGLIVARDPGVIFVWGGAVALLLGVFLVFFFPNRRAWALIKRREDGTTSVRIGAVVRHDVGYQAEFAKFIDGLKLALSGRSAS